MRDLCRGLGFLYTPASRLYRVHIGRVLYKHIHEYLGCAKIIKPSIWYIYIYGYMDIYIYVYIYIILCVYIYTHHIEGFMIFAHPEYSWFRVAGLRV